MSLLPKSTQWRKREPLIAVVVTLIAIGAGGLHPGDRRSLVVREADTLPYRTIEGRLANTFAYRPYRDAGQSARTERLSLEATAAVLRKRWDAARDGTATRTSAEAQILAGKSEAAAALLADVLEQDSGRADHLAAIQSSRNAELLTDFSAAMLARPRSARALVLAFEAADRARRLAPMPSAAWNCALSAERIGAQEAAARGWRDAAALEPSPDWKREASLRAAAAARAVHPPKQSPELFFHGHLTAKAAAGEAVGDFLPADRLASDAGRMLETRDRERFRIALETYANGREAFARDDLGPACRAFSEAGEVLASMRNPLALLVAEQEIRCQCVRAQPECLARIRTLRARLVALERYPWLAARTAYAEGQALYRQGRIYEAAESFNAALREFLAVGDEASAGLTHSVLGNTYSVAGEADTALEHHLAAVRLRYAYAGDRRRIQLEDAMLFLLRHRYVATAEIRARDTLVRSRGRLIQHVRSAIKTIGERIPSGTTEAFHKRAVACLPDGLREALLPLIEMIEQLTRRIREFDRKVEQLAEDRYPDTGALTQVCGVGSLTALAYILTLKDERRFRRSRSVGAWLGLVPGQHDSGESQPQWHITKQGDPYLRRLLVGSAQYILGPFAKDCDLRRHGLAIAARGGANARKRAVVAGARNR